MRKKRRREREGKLMEELEEGKREETEDNKEGCKKIKISVLLCRLYI
jgi:hypothetical protein